MMDNRRKVVKMKKSLKARACGHILLVILLFMGVELRADARSAEQPNIVVILCDDLGYGDLGIMGHPYIQSPNIDGLARDGIQFTEAYMSAAWCGPYGGDSSDGD